MTCIVGIAHRGTVYIGGDSAAVAGCIRRVSRVPKVFRRGPFLIGYTTSFRMGQLLAHHLEVPAQHPDEDDVEYLVKRFVEAVRTLLKEKGFTKVESNSESGGQFLVGYRGRLSCVDNDFQVGESADGFEALGSGAELALGALKALERLPPRRRIARALAVAAHFSTTVCPPFVVRTLRA